MTALRDRLMMPVRRRRRRLKDGGMIAAARIRELEVVDQPICLISQIQRSGGTLLSQLTDGHPHCHAYPLELRIGKGKNWPRLDLDAPAQEWYRALDTPIWEVLVRDGYAKEPKWNLGEDTRRHPFVLPPGLREELFLAAVGLHRPTSQREVVDAYMTSFFNAWLDNRNLHGTRKSWITAFAAGLALDRRNIDRFFADYPDGRLVSIVREPASWFASARAYRPEVYSDRPTAIGLWSDSARATIDAASRFADQVLVLRFEDLVTATGPTMNRVAGWLGIDPAPSLYEPTFNGLPIGANSSFSGEAAAGLLTAPADRASLLSEEDRMTIEQACRELHDRATASVSRSAG